MTAPHLTVTVLRTFAAFCAIEQEWGELFAAAVRPSTCLRHSWLRLSWQKHWQRFPNRLRVVVVREGGVPVMAGAFVLTVRHMKWSFHVLSSGLPQAEDVLWRASEHTAAQARLLLEALRSEIHLPGALCIGHLPERSPLHEAIRGLGLSRKVGRTHTSAHVPLGAHRNHEQYFATLSPGLRQDHARQLRRLGDLPGYALSFETGAAARGTLQWLFDTKRRWLERSRRRAEWLSGGHIDRFLPAFLDDGDDVPETWIASLRTEGRIMASAILFIERDVVQFSKLAHDPAFDTYSPGRTLTLLLIRSAFERGFAEFDLGHGPIEWKRRLRPSIRTVTSERIALK